jgi:tetraacyldisaccharide 4'-kinase
VAEVIWNDPASGLRRLALLPLWLLEAPYRAGAWLHRGSYRWGLARPIRLPARVIAVGNLTVGGSGKTPVAAWLAAELHARGHKVAILSRGVRGRAAARVNVVSDGQRVLRSPAEVGDEPVWLARTLRGVPVLAGRNRVALGLRAVALFGVEVLLLDDGFQHHRVQRDLNLVCVDAALGLGNGHVLPRGPLREPVGALDHADAILWTRVPPELSTRPSDARIPARIPAFRMRMTQRQLRSVVSGEAHSLDELRGLEVGAFTGIARPDRLRQDLERLGARVSTLRVFPDHHLYTRADLESLDRAVHWITTAKDAVKIPASWVADARIDAVEEDVESPDRVALLDWLTKRLGRPRFRA